MTIDATLRHHDHARPGRPAPVKRPLVPPPPAVDPAVNLPQAAPTSRERSFCATECCRLGSLIAIAAVAWKRALPAPAKKERCSRWPHQQAAKME